MDGCMTKRVVEMILNDFQTRPGLRLRPQGRLQGVHVFARVETCLQLADVVPTFRERQRRVASQSTLKVTFTEHGVIEGTKTRGQSAQAADQTELTQNPALECSE